MLFFKKTNKADAVIICDDNRIAQSGKKTIENGGNAADAMASMLITGAVVLPSRMGLSAGGVCQILDPNNGQVNTLGFLSSPMTFDKKTGTPSLPRGVYTLKDKYGIKPWSDAFVDAIDLAEQGTKVSDDLSIDIVHTTGLPVQWKNLKSGDTLQQKKLAQTLKTLSKNGVGTLYSGDMASSLVSQSDQIIQEDLKETKASIMDSIDVSINTGKTFFANPTILSSDGYLLWKNLQKTDKAEQAQTAINDLKNTVVSSEDAVYGTSLISTDKSGLVIVCSISMGRRFGTGQLTEEGFYLSNPISYKEKGFVFLNVLQTNPDVTDVIYALTGVGNYALADGINFMAEKQLLISNKNKEKSTDFIEFSCEKGYPNDFSSCQQNEKTHPILTQQDLTK